MTLHLNCRVERGAFLLDLDANFPDREVTVLFGPSGSGKTSILRLIAGLDRAPGVRVAFKEEIWQDEQTFVPPHQRRVGYVFQHLNLFPNMNARQNLDFAEQRAHTSEGLSRADITEVLDIGDLLDKLPDQLSGGEKQRVAIARTLLSHPGLMLMDEPLGSIDQAAKNRILPYLQRVHQLLDIPVVFVSHAMDEVLYLADTVMEIRQGQMIQQDTVIGFSTSEGAAASSDAAAILRCRVLELDSTYSLTSLEVDGQRLMVSKAGFSVGDQVRVRIPARDVSITREPARETSILNVLECTVRTITDPGEGPAAMVNMTCGRQTLLARITRRSLHELLLREGDKVYAQIKGVALMIEYER